MGFLGVYTVLSFSFCFDVTETGNLGLSFPNFSPPFFFFSHVSEYVLTIWNQFSEIIMIFRVFIL